MSDTEKVEKITDAKKPRSERLQWLKSPLVKGAAIGTAATATLFLVAGASNKKGYNDGYADGVTYLDSTVPPAIDSPEE